MALELMDIAKILMAMLVGGVVGVERRYRDKAAGVRTMIFICVGATLFTIFSMKIALVDADRTRIAANIVSGVGFLGAGAIIRDAGRIKGLTSAATIWIVAALGMGIGNGDFLFILSAMALIMFVLFMFRPMERFINRSQQKRAYRVVCPIDMDKLNELDKLFEDSGLKIKHHKRMKRDGKLICTWDTVGSPTVHNQVTSTLLDDKAVEEVRF